MPYVRDSFWRGREFVSLHHMTEPSLVPARYLVDLVKADHLGRKNGRGFHLYETL